MAHRLERIKSELVRILAEIFLKYGKEFGVGMVSVNDILVSPDLADAKVTISFINSQNSEADFNRVVKHGREIQTLVYKRLQIRRVPKINWVLDTDPTKSYRIEQLLDDIKRTHPKDPGV